MEKAVEYMSLAFRREAWALDINLGLLAHGWCLKQESEMHSGTGVCVAREEPPTGQGYEESAADTELR